MREGKSFIYRHEKEYATKIYKKNVRASDIKAFYTIESVKKITEDDLNVMEDRPRSTTRLRNLIRK